ncbi:hypothetical protein GLA29479_3437 [Lysobacter antibioticus]|uniref:hypothetical protein n=1 Tax=Lysobacter antibioticus TaxID=84531 RepID=UPI00071743A6|nr:hypothetical protein [Lysobacter antibioticus]ALN64290.1 hypothetical protein GLA29479_3437 [Lysobacter antibioticus]
MDSWTNTSTKAAKRAGKRAGKKAALSASLAALVLAAAPACAGEGYLLHRYGDKPTRGLIYADSSWIETALSPEEESRILFADGPDAAMSAREAAPRSIRVFEVMEHQSAPDKIVHHLQFDCARGQARSTAVEVYRRNDTQESRAPSEWAPTPAGWMTQAQRFACEPASRNPEHGMTPLDGAANQLTVVDLSWQRFWTDGKRPRYTTSRSKTRIAARQQEVESTLARLSGAMDQVHTELRDQQDDARAQAEASARNARASERRQRTPNPALESWIDAPVQLLVGTWGDPLSYREEDSSRWLHYVFGATGPMREAAPSAPAADTGRCTIRFMVRNGSIYDYTASGAGASCKNAAIPVRSVSI